MNKYRYVLRLGSATGKLFGASHGSMDSYKTLCGKNIDDHFWITHNAFDGNITCKECLKQLQENG